MPLEHEPPDGNLQTSAHTPEPVTPDGILQLGLGFWASKALLRAVELGLFSILARGPQPAEGLLADLGLQRRGSIDWLDALVSLGMLDRTEVGYANTPAWMGEAGFRENYAARLAGPDSMVVGIK